MTGSVEKGGAGAHLFSYPPQDERFLLTGTLPFSLYLQESTVRWIPLLVFFVLAWIEISLFIQVAHVMGVLLTMLLVVFTSCIGVSLVKNQGMKNFMLMQEKLARNESPATEMIKSVSLIIAGFLLLLPGFFTDLLGLLLLLPPVQKHLTLKLMPHLRVWRGPGAGPDSGYTMDGEFERKNSDRLEHHDDHQDR
ncbi:FxsA family protein [Pantoea sp. M_8]|nr:FxsA family protein [Pantoea sp. M_6]KAA5976926.1 FxsA family protein [Pantoea sp. M_8]KAA5990729.1 FxsA family protein [Pantoea sp. M_10]KAA5997452.1 FxsA family protein [Pantoea sp. M_5]KKB05722.1 phage T7 F exclusion suppressor FxsA [Pantoea anthophila]PZL86512.1 membrane protein FxsA [Pantoea sp. ARC270]TPE16670.1 FxsA family protein [Pantoea vagans]